MTDKHMKRLESPKSWKIPRKTRTFITNPQPGGHPEHLGMSLNTLLKEIANIVDTTKETDYLLQNDTVLINQKQTYDHDAQVGFLDIISLPNHDKHLLISIGQQGHLHPINIDDNTNTLAKITGKTYIKGGNLQLNLHNGNNILTDENNYTVGDTILLNLEQTTVEDHFTREQTKPVFVFTGKHAGKKGTIKQILDDTLVIETNDGKFQTRKDYTIITGNKKPEIDLVIHND